MASDATGTTPDEWAVWRAFLAAQAQLTLETDRRLRAHGLSSGEYGSLAALRDARGRLRIGELAAQLGWEKSRTSHLVTRMEERGFVTREPVADDRRATDIVITPLGSRTALGAVRDHAADVRELFLDRMQPEERAVVARVLDRILSGPTSR